MVLVNFLMHCAKWSWRNCLSSPAADASLTPADSWRPGTRSQLESIYWWSGWHFDFHWCKWKWTISHPCSVTGFPGNSADKESASKAGDSGSIPGSGSSPGEGIGYPLQYSWVSLVAQTVKNPPAMWKTWALRSLGWENPLEEEMATHSSILAWRIPWTERSLEGYSPWGHQELDVIEWADKRAILQDTSFPRFFILQFCWQDYVLGNDRKWNRSTKQEGWTCGG